MNLHFDAFKVGTAARHFCKCNHISMLGCGGGQVVSVLTFYSDDRSSNPTGAYSFL